MITIDWPDMFPVCRLELRIMHNTKVFISPLASTAQVLNYTGERWMASVGVAEGGRASLIWAAKLEALLDRLNGQSNRLRIWNFMRPAPLGTLRDGVTANVVNGSLAAVSVVNGSLAAVTVIAGSPTNAYPIAAGAGTTTITTVPGRTLFAGDHLGLANGQNVRNLVDVVADANGLMPIEFQPRARTPIAGCSSVVWNKPLISMMNKNDGAPVSYRPGMVDATSVDLIEAL